MTSANAAMEHTSNGQIGQPAACMIESNRSSLTAAPFWKGAIMARERSRSTGFQRTAGVQLQPSAVHRRCGQHCGQPVADGADVANFKAIRQIADFLGNEKSLEINTLCDCERTVTGRSASSASIRATVEFSTRADAGFADD